MGSIEDGKFLDWLSDYQLLKKDCTTWSHFSFFSLSETVAWERSCLFKIVYD
jgi:hypothetical protein